MAYIGDGPGPITGGPVPLPPTSGPVPLPPTSGPGGDPHAPVGDPFPPFNEPSPQSWASPEQTLIGVKTPRLVPTLVGTPTILRPSGYEATTFDITTYEDRALLRLYASATATKQTDFGIVGKKIVQTGGKGGYIWEYSDEADIEKNGENAEEIKNTYIMGATQVEAIGDFWVKETRSKDIYTLTLNGTHPYLEVGDLWNIDIEYTLPSATSETELINVDAEVIGITTSRNAGEIGSTQVTLRVPTGRWSKTISRRSRLISRPWRLVRQ